MVLLFITVGCNKIDKKGNIEPRMEYDNKYKMKCIAVNNSISRCENIDAVCYRTYNGLQCKIKGDK